MMKKRLYHVMHDILWAALCLTLLEMNTLEAHEIHLKNGKIIKTRSVEERGADIIYESKGGLIGISRNLVEKIVYDDLSQSANTETDSAMLLAHYPLDANLAGDRLHPENQWAVSGARPVADRTEALKAAYRFDGIDNVIQAGLPALPDPPLTISFWFKISQHPSVGQYLFSYGAESGKEPGLYCTILGKREETLSRSSWSKSGIQCGAVLRGSSLWSLISVESFSVERWHHILFSWEDSAKLRLFIDGNLRSAQTDRQENELLYSAPAVLRLGAAPENFSDGAFRGTLDDIRIYQGLLSSQEIQDLSNYTPREPNVLPSSGDEDE